MMQSMRRWRGYCRSYATAGQWSMLDVVQVDSGHFFIAKFSSYIGVDLIRYAGLPVEALFVGADLNAGVVPLKSEVRR